MPLKEFKDSPLAKDLRNPTFAAKYLEIALEDSVADFLIALRNVAEANGGLGKLAAGTKLGRESLYKSLPLQGDSKPYFATIQRVLATLGMRLSVRPRKKRAA